MGSRRGRRILACAAVVALASTGCSSDDAPASDHGTAAPASAAAPPVEEAADCPDLAARAVDALQLYVNEFTHVQPDRLNDVLTEQQGRLDEVSAAVRDRADQLGCADLRTELAAELRRLEGHSPVARSVAATIRSSLLGTDDPSDPGAVNRTVERSGQLAAAVASAGTGSTITLRRGTYELDETLVVFRPLTIRGPAEGRAVIESSAGGAAILSLTTGNLQLASVTIRHVGPEPASVVVVRAGGHRLEDVEVSGGRVGEDGGDGFGLVLRPQTSEPDARQEVRDSRFLDNDRGGVLVAASASPTLHGLAVEGAGECGVCYGGKASGRLEASEVHGHTIGVRIQAEAAPTIADSIIRDNSVGIGAIGSGAVVVTGSTITDNDTGIELGGSGSPRIEDSTLRDNASTGIRLGSETQAKVIDVTIEGSSDVGLVVIGSAAPRIRGGSVRTTGESGIVFTGSTRGSLAGTSIGGPRIGVQVGKNASPMLRGLTLEDVGDAAVVLAGQSTPSVADVTCTEAAAAGGVVVLTDSAAPDLGDGLACALADQR